MIKRNGKIELLRFIFCAYVFLFHINKHFFDSKLGIGSFFEFFRHGNMGVEFFFILSGFLLAKSACKPINDYGGYSLGSDTVSFMKRKILAVFPAHTVAYIITFVSHCALHKILSIPGIISLMVRALPGFLFMNKVGIKFEAIISVEWYISSMLICMLIIYPLCRKYGKTFTNVIAPIAGILILGYLFHRYGGTGTASVWTGFTFKTNLRAFSLICLGTTCYSVCNRISKMSFTRFDRILLTVFEFGCFFATLIYICSDINTKYSAIIIMCMLAEVTLIFSGITFGNKLFTNKFTVFLGKLSLPFYLSQIFTFNIVKMFFLSLPTVPLILVNTAITAALSFVVLWLSAPLGKAIDRTLKRLDKHPAHIAQ